MANQAKTPLMTINISTFPGRDTRLAHEVQGAFLAEITRRNLDELGPIDVRLVGWRGIEGKDVVVEVRDQLGANLYEMVTPDMVSRIIQSHIEEERPLRPWLASRDYQEFYELQKNYISELVGLIDPVSWEEYQDYDGYKGLQTFFSQGFDAFLQKVVASGFREINRIVPESVGARWSEIRLEKSRPLLLINGAMPMPNPGPTRFLSEGAPHQVLEGALLAAQTLRSPAVIFYLLEDAGLALERLRLAWQAFQSSRLWPAKEPLVEVHIVTGKGRFMMEDEDLLIRTLSGELPPAFWDKYPRPVFQVQSLLAISTLPFIAQQPVGWFRTQGFECAPGTKIFQLLGSV